MSFMGDDFGKTAKKIFLWAILGNIVIWGAIAGLVILILWLCHVI